MSAHTRLFFLLLALLPVQLGYHFWPPFAHVLGRQIDYLSPTLFFTDILLVATLVAWGREARPKIRHVLTRPTTVLVFAFALINIWLSASPAVSAYKWVKALEYVLLGWYVVRTRPSVSFVIHALSLGVFFSSLLALTQFALQRSLGGALWIIGERTFALDTPGIARVVVGGRELLRPYATFPHPNVLGGFLAAVVPLVLWDYARLKTTHARLFSLATSALGMLALAATFSRSAWIVGAVGIGYVLTKRKKTILFVVPLLLLIGFFVLRPSGTDESVVVRTQLIAAAIRLWQEAPLFGVGLGGFLVRLPEALISRQIYFLQPVHNIYLLLLSETGVLGGAAFLFLVYASVHKAKTSSRRDGYLLPLTALLILGLVDHYPVTLQQGQLLLALLLALAQSSKIG